MMQGVVPTNQYQNGINKIRQQIIMMTKGKSEDSPAMIPLLA